LWLVNHKVYGEDVAVLAGDALLTYAFEYIATQTPQAATDSDDTTAERTDARRVLQVIALLGKAVGAAGLVGGQIVDLASEGTVVSEETLTFIHRHKTAALLEVSVTSGAILAGAEPAVVERLKRYAQQIGLAFQIVDDILDITSTSEALGKSVGKDVAAQKATYPSLWGLEESQRKADRLIADAIAQLSEFGEKAQPLAAIAQYVTARTH
ncbi:MAG: polyprenyl synthetase family protein, partial [Cyanobacteria bacterium J06555_13]